MNEICCGEIKCCCPTCKVRDQKVDGPGVKSGLSVRSPLGKPLGKSMTRHGYPPMENEYCPPSAYSGETE